MSDAKNLDNKILEIRTRGCDLCLYEKIADFERAYVNKEMHVQDIISAIKSDGVQVNNWQWYKHIRSHVRPEVGVIVAETAGLLANDAMDKISECYEAVVGLKSQIDKITTSLDAESDPVMIKAYTALSAETRHWLELLAKLQGEFKDVAKIQINSLNVEYNNVVGTVLQEACPVCKAKFIEKLSPKLLNPNPPK